MNGTLIITVAILLGCLLNGRRRGLIRTMFSLFSLIVSVLLTTIVTPTISEYLQSNEAVVSYVEDKVLEPVGDYLINSDVPLTEGEVDTLLQNLSIPEGVINAGTYVIVFLVANLVLIILGRALDLISKLPGLNALNKTGGAIAGLAQGILLIWILCILLAIFSNAEFASKTLEQIQANVFLSYLHDNNLLLKGVIGLVKIFR